MVGSAVLVAEKAMKVDIMCLVGLCVRARNVERVKSMTWSCLNEEVNSFCSVLSCSEQSQQILLEFIVTTFVESHAYVTNVSYLPKLRIKIFLFKN